MPGQLISMASDRLFRFPKPAWLNNANTRTAGVYTAGALVGSPRMDNTEQRLIAP